MAVGGEALIADVAAIACGGVTDGDGGGSGGARTFPAEALLQTMEETSLAANGGGMAATEIVSGYWPGYWPASAFVICICQGLLASKMR